MVRLLLNINNRNIAFSILLFFLIVLNSNIVAAQDPFIQVKSESTICEGDSTTLEVIINAGVGPYTVVYSDGTSNFTVENYHRIVIDDEVSGDPITVSPTSSTSYELISLDDQYGSLPVSAATADVTVNPLVSGLTITINSSDPV